MWSVRKSKSFLVKRRLRGDINTVLEPTEEVNIRQRKKLFMLKDSAGIQRTDINWPSMILG